LLYKMHGHANTMKPPLKGRGARSNANSRFSQKQYVQEHPEGIDEAWLQGTTRTLFFESPKKIVNKVTSPDLPIPYSMNPYQGCEHGCIYCYARPSHEYWGYSAGLDFETKIIVKKNAPALLAQHFKQKSWQAAPISLAGNTDCYQPVEKEMRLTRQLLQVCLDFGNPVGVITKNALVQRDTDLLEALAAQQLVHVWFSITTFDEGLRQKMEPRTASTAKRLAVMEALSARGIPCGIMAAPMVPGLNAHELPKLLEAAANAGALNAGYTVIRLNGALGPLFTEWLEEHYPDRAAKVLHQIAAMHGGQLEDLQLGRRMRGQGPEAQSIKMLFDAARKKHFAGRNMPAYNLKAFKRPGQLGLF